MTFCVYCFKKIDSLRDPCPYCGAPAVYKSDFNTFGRQGDKTNDIENITESEKDDYIIKSEVSRLYSRGMECYKTGRAYLASKNKSSARREFQRALKYFETILKIDPTHIEARELRSKCLQKMT